MYQTSDAYKQAIRQPTQRHHIKGTIGSVAFADDNILAGSFTISNQCSGDSELEIGQVYVGELSATFTGLALDRYAWQGLAIRPSFSLVLDDGTAEDVPLGVFDISEATWGADGVAVRAYDRMARFDKTWTDDAEGRSPYQWARRACEACRVTLGTTEAQMRRLPNGGVTLKAYDGETTDIRTWRDLLSWLAQTLCANATIDRAGSLVFRTFRTEPDDSMDNYHRFEGAAFADYVTRYTGLSCVDMETRMTRYYAMPTDDGLTYNLGSNPLLQYGDEGMLTERRRAILKKLATAQYVPFSASSLRDPAYDLMDVIRCTDGLAGGGLLACVTKYTYTFHGGMELSGAGKDPALASGNSKSDKNIDGLLDRLNTLENSEIAYYFYVNRDAYEIGSGQEAVIADIDYAANPSDGVIFHLEATLDIETTEEETAEAYTEGDAHVEVTYLYDGHEMTDTQPAADFMDGTRRLNLVYFYDQGEDDQGNFKARLAVSGGRASIAAGDCRAYITAKNRGPREFYVEITQQPNRKTYLVGEQLDFTGLVIAKVYENKTEDITELCSFDPPEGYELPDIEAEIEDVEIVATYEEENADGETITYTVSFFITEKKEGFILQELRVAVNQNPEDPNRFKQDYYVGEEFSLTGMTVYAYYSNGYEGEDIDVTALCDFTPAAGEVLDAPDEFSVGIRYTDEEGDTAATEWGPVRVAYPQAVSIAVTKTANKVNYYANCGQDTEISYAGLKVTAYFEDGTEADVTELCEFSPAEGADVAQYALDNPVYILYRDDDLHTAETGFRVIDGAPGSTVSAASLLADDPPTDEIITIRKASKAPTFSGLTYETDELGDMHIYAEWSNGMRYDVEDKCEIDPPLVGCPQETEHTATYRHGGRSDKVKFTL